MAVSSLAGHAEDLARSGRTKDALDLLGDAAAEGHPDALFTLGKWYLSGSFVQRDLASSRDLFRRSGDAGNQEGAGIYRTFIANGTGGPRDWQGALKLLQSASSREPKARRQYDLIRKMKLSDEGEPLSLPAPEILNEGPDIRFFPGLFSAGECDFMVASAEPLFTPSVVIDPQTGRHVPNSIRTSDGAAFPLALENPAIHALNRRIAAASGTEASQGEPLQVLKYSPGQEYRAHLDALPGVDNQRIFTMLVYLNDAYEGGETCFLETGLKVRAGKGDGLLFANATVDGRPDPRSRHAGLPVTTGVKVIASRWIRARPLDLSGPGNTN